MVLVETDRLNKKVSLLKNSPSAYFSKVIGLSKAADAFKLKKHSKRDRNERTNHSTVMTKTESEVVE